VTVTSPLHPELQGYYEEEGGRAWRASHEAQRADWSLPTCWPSAAMASDGRYRPLSARPGEV